MLNTSDTNWTTLNDPMSVGLSSLLSLIVRQYFSHIFCTCYIGNASEMEVENSYYPSIWISTVETQESTLLSSVENGCQSFIVAQNFSLDFLDHFEYIHDRANLRFPNKNVIVLINQDSEPSVMDTIVAHPAVRDIPRLLMLFPVEGDRIDLITNRFSSRKDAHDLITLDTYIPSQDNFLQGTNLFPDKLLNLEGRYLRLAVFNYIPYTIWNEVNSSADSNVFVNHVPILHLEGTESRIFLEFCLMFNCSLDLSLDEAGEWGEIFDNRTGNGIIGAVVERRADIGVGALYSWHHESLFLTLSKPISRTGVTCITPKPRLLSSWMTPILPFSNYLWIAVLTTFAVMSLFKIFMDFMMHNVLEGHNKRVDLCGAFMVIISTFVMQTIILRINSTKFVTQMIIIGSLLFVGLMVGNVYSGGLSAIMTIPQYEPPIDTVQELADSNMFWASTHDAWIFSILMATQATIIKLLQNFQTHPKEILHRHAQQHDLAYSVERLPYGHFAIGEYIDEQASHEYHLMVEDIYWENCVAMSTKTWPMMEHLDELILLIFQSGIQRFWEQQVVSQYDNNQVQLAIANSRQKDSPGPITLQPSHLLGAFLLLGFGLATGMLTFLLELLSGKLL